VTLLKKIFTIFVVEAVLLGGAFGGGLYYESVKRKAVEKKLADTEEVSQKMLLTTRARAQLTEAALGVLYGNYAMAFERTIRAEAYSNRLGLNLGKEFAELQSMLMAQKPIVREKLLDVADKIEPPVPLGPPPGSIVNAKPAEMVKPGAVAAPSAAGAATGMPPAAPKPALPEAMGATAAAAVVPAAGPVAAGGTIGTGAELKAEGKAGRGPGAPRALTDARDAILQAKVGLLAGEDATVVAKKLASAMVVLEENGVSDLSEELAAALKAVRSHDEAKAKPAIDAALAHVRTL
jgi:hypothetical protein